MSQIARRLENRFPDHHQDIKLLLCTLSLMRLSHQNVFFHEQGIFIVIPSGKTEINESFFEGFKKLDSPPKREEFINTCCQLQVTESSSIPSSSLISRFLQLFRPKKTY